MNPLLALLALGGTTVAAVAVVAAKKNKDATTPPKGRTIGKPVAESVELNQSKAVLATVDQGTTSRSSTVNSYGRRGGSTGRTTPPAAKKTLGGVVATMMRHEGPEAHDRKRRAMGPAGSIVTEPRSVPRGLPLNVVASAYTNAQAQQTRMPGVAQEMDKNDARQIVSPTAAPALARSTGFNLK